jgi:hypothetical protein
MGKQTSRLTGTEWALMRDIAFRMQMFVIDDLSTVAVYGYLVERTLAWKRFSVELVAVHLADPDPGSHSHGVPVPQSSAYRGLQRLVERGIVYSQKNKTLRTLTINWPAILRKHIDQLESQDLTVNTKRLESLHTTITKEFESMKLKSRTIAFTRGLKTKEAEESFSLGDETHEKEIQKKTRQKKAKLTVVERKPIENLTVHAVREYYETTSEEHGLVPYQWDSKDYGQVKNYINECKKEGRDLIQILGIAIRHWGKLSNYLSLLADDYYIPSGMLWCDFYNFRGHIYDWIWHTKSGQYEGTVHHEIVWEDMAENGTPITCSKESHRIEIPSLTEYISVKG